MLKSKCYCFCVNMSRQLMRCCHLGCSKFSCLMCARFIHFHGKFTTRGCDGPLFRPWTLPEVAGLGAGQRDRIVGAVIKLQKDLKKELKSEANNSESRERTSAIGGSSILSDHWSEGSERRSDLERRKLKAEQERVAEMFKRLLPHTAIKLQVVGTETSMLRTK